MALALGVMVERLTRLRRYLLWAMCSPFLFLSLLSPHVMPARSADGLVAMVLCSGDSLAVPATDLAHGAPADQTPADRFDQCHWARAHVAALDLGWPALPAAVAVPVAAAPASARLILTEIRATGRPPATGPPAAA